MNDNNLLDSLLSDKDALSKRTKIARFRESHEAIESALALGFSYESVRNQLKKGGLDLSEAVFKNFLHKVRKEKKAN